MYVGKLAQDLLDEVSRADALSDRGRAKVAAQMRIEPDTYDTAEGHRSGSTGPRPVEQGIDVITGNRLFE